MNNLKHYSAKQIFTSWWVLPQYMHVHKVTVADLKAGRIKSKTVFVFALVMAWAEEGCRHYRRLERVNIMRNYKRKYGLYSGDHLAFMHMLRRINLTDEKLNNFINGTIDKLGLYDTPEGVKAKLSGTFGYDPMDSYEYELSLHRDVSCENEACGSTSTIYCEDSDDVEKISNWFANDFQHVTGPYCRCLACDTVSRVKVSPATEVSSVYSTGEEHSEYVDHLGELIGELTEHMKKHGLRAPDKLALTARNIDWRRRTGTAMCDADPKDLADMMSVNSDFTITNGKLWLEPDGTGSLSCVMSHHDAPTGGSIEAIVAWECDLNTGSRYDNNFCYGDQLSRAKLLAQIATEILPGWKGERGEYTSHATFELVSSEGLADQLQWLRGDFTDQLPGNPTRSDALAYTLSESLLDLETRVKRETLDPLLLHDAVEFKTLADVYFEDRPSDTSDEESEG